jgi:hypothetical protein
MTRCYGRFCAPPDPTPIYSTADRAAASRLSAVGDEPPSVSRITILHEGRNKRAGRPAAEESNNVVSLCSVVKPANVAAALPVHGCGIRTLFFPSAA